MKKPTEAVFLLLIVFSVAAAQNTEQALKPRPAPEMQRLARMSRVRGL
jgi:hypothetical protein